MQAVTDNKHHGTQSKYSHLWGELAGDTAAAALSATCVAPAVSIIDRSVGQETSEMDELAD